MTSYENPVPREGVNTSSEHPLKEFGQLVLGIGALIVLLIVLVNAFAGVIAKQIPFSFEQTMVGELVDEFDYIEVVEGEHQQRLQAVAIELIPLMALPDEMSVTVHYSEEEVVNAFATLGGHLIFFKGLVDKLESEEELAAVMAHEIAHIKHRHPISALGKGVLLGTVAAFVGGASGSTAGEWLIGSSTNLGMMKFSRDQERQADLEAAEALQKRYGHIQGANELFDRFTELEQEQSAVSSQLNSVELFRSHPHTEDRWTTLKKMAEERGWNTQGALTPLTL